MASLGVSMLRLFCSAPWDPQKAITDFSRSRKGSREEQKYASTSLTFCVHHLLMSLCLQQVTQPSQWASRLPKARIQENVKNKNKKQKPGAINVSVIHVGVSSKIIGSKEAPSIYLWVNKTNVLDDFGIVTSEGRMTVWGIIWAYDSMTWKLVFLMP